MNSEQVSNPIKIMASTPQGKKKAIGEFLVCINCCFCNSRTPAEQLLLVELTDEEKIAFEDDDPQGTFFASAKCDGCGMKLHELINVADVYRTVEKELNK